MPAPKYQLVVGYVGRPGPRGPSTGVGRWLTTRADGVVRVERAPGVARDASARPEPAPATPTRADRDAAAAERDAAVYAMLEHATARQVAQVVGRTRDAVLGASLRHRRHHGLPPRVTPAAIAAEVRHAALVAAAAHMPPAVVAERAAVTVRTVRAAVRRAQPLRLTVTCAPVVHDGTRLSLVEIGPGMCRDLGDDGLCCCLPTRAGTSWCPGHYALYTRSGARAA